MLPLTELPVKLRELVPESLSFERRKASNLHRENSIRCDRTEIECLFYSQPQVTRTARDSGTDFEKLSRTIKHTNVCRKYLAPDELLIFSHADSLPANSTPRAGARPDGEAADRLLVRPVLLIRRMVPMLGYLCEGRKRAHFNHGDEVLAAAGATWMANVADVYTHADDGGPGGAASSPLALAGLGGPGCETVLGRRYIQKWRGRQATLGSL